MSRGGTKRRLRVRRRRRRDEPGLAWDVTVEAGTTAGEEVVAEFGCCVVEAVGTASVVAALLLVPAWLLMR